MLLACELRCLSNSGTAKLLCKAVGGGLPANFVRERVVIGKSHLIANDMHELDVLTVTVTQSQSLATGRYRGCCLLTRGAAWIVRPGSTD